MNAVITRVLSQIPPLWELDCFIAVNPFLGWAEQPFAQAISQLEGVWQRPILPDRDGRPLLPALPDWRMDTAATLLGPFLASYFDQGQAIWPAPWKKLPLLEAWLSSLPGSSGLVGLPARRLKGWRKQLPRQIDAAWAYLFEKLQMSEAEWEHHLQSLLAELPGWAGYLRRRAWPEAPAFDSELSTLALMLVVVDQIVPLKTEPVHHQGPGFGERLSWLEAREARYRDELGAISRRRPADGPAPQPLARAAFCIDVRSEVLRRAWEAQSEQILTDGFAGFFGMPLAWHGNDGTQNLLPALLSPVVQLQSATPEAPRDAKLKSDMLSGPHGLAFVEVGGALSFFSILAGLKPSRKAGTYAGIEAAARALPREQKISLAATLLKNLGWQAPWAQLMIFVGHGSTCVNNPHAAALECGACGGRSGEANARMAAALCNDPEVRAGLRVLGWDLPESVLFLGGRHDTALDEVELFTHEAPPAFGSAIAEVRAQLGRAGERARAERLATFPFLGRPAARRVRDWAETRPETGLAGNVCMIVAPRAQTRGLNLRGQAFLHSYDAAQDADGSVLELILTAPVVVASWINLQYFSSTASPDVYGSGNKMLHTIVAGIGVYEGNVPDLKQGLTRQSVDFDGEPYHPTLRLHVLVQASQPAIDRVLARHPAVRALVENGWIHLFAFAPGGDLIQRTQAGWLAPM